MTGALAALVIPAVFMLGVRLGWKSDWARRLFRVGPYRRTKPVPYRFKD